MVIYMKITKDDIKNNAYNIMLCVFYTIILCVVYGMWSFKALQLWWLTLIIVVVILTVGFVVGILWTKSNKVKAQKE